MNKKKKINIWIKILIFFFIIYCGLYIANLSGYYETKIKDKTVLTEKSIREFEDKIKNGEEVDIDSYLIEKKVDYSSNLSYLGDNLTSGIEKVLEETANIMTNILKSLF